MELRRGYRETRIGGLGFPAIRFFSHLERIILLVSGAILYFCFPF
jgi:hypothetical protein